MSTEKGDQSSPAKNLLGNLTLKEQELMVKAHLCFNEQPSVDMPKLAAMTGYTNPASTYNAFNKASKKVKANWAEKDKNGNPIVPAKSPKKSATPKRGKKASANTDVKDEDEDMEPFGSASTDSNSSPNKRAVDDDEEDELASQTPPKKKRAPAKKKETEYDEEGELASQTPPKKKRAPAKKKESKYDEEGNPVPTPKRGRAKKNAKPSPATVEEEDDDSDEAIFPVATPTPAPKKPAAGGGRKKKAEATVTVQVATNAPASSPPEPITPTSKTAADALEQMPTRVKDETATPDDVAEEELPGTQVGTNDAGSPDEEQEAEHVNVVDKMATDTQVAAADGTDS